MKIAVARALGMLVALTLAFGCKKKDDAPAVGGSPGAAATGTAAAAPRAPGAMPFDFASGPTTAKAGDYVLVPSKNWIDDAFTKGGDKQTFIYYAAKMVEPGPLESKVKSLSGTEFSAPNGFIVPLRSGQRARPGDVVLTWWQTGSGMQRSIVVGGSADEPKALYLDMDYDNPSGSAKKEDALKRDSFHVLGGVLEPGVSVACKDGAAYKHWIVTAVAPTKLLVIGWAGSMRAFPRASCTPIPPSAKLAAGRDVAVPYIGSFYKGKVDRVDARVGRAFVKFTWGGKEKTEAFGIQNVAAPLPGL